MSTPRRDPEVVIRRAILAVWSAVVVFASGFGFVACLVGLIHQGHPILIFGMIGCLLGVVSGFYLATVAMRPFPRTF